MDLKNSSFHLLGKAICKVDELEHKLAEREVEAKDLFVKNGQLKQQILDLEKKIKKLERKSST